MSNGITITRTKDEPGATTLAVEASLEAVQSAELKAARQFAKRARIPGFRKGKAPPEVIRRRFGDAIRESVLQELITDSWKQALDTETLEPLGNPHVRELKFEANQPVTFELVVEVKPDVKIERTGGFTVERKVAPVTDAQIDEQLDTIRRQKAPWVPREAKAEAGDLVRVTIATMKEGVADEGRPYELVLGSGQALPDIEDRIMTMSPGETLETVVKFPDDFQDEAKRGQSVSTRIELHEVKRQDLPDLTDDFAREVGDFDTAEELRKAIREDMGASAERDADAEVRRQLIEQVIAANNVPAPRPMVERGLRAFAEVYQVPEEQLDKFATEFAPVVEQKVKRDLVIDTIARSHELAATEDDLDDRIAKIAERQGTEPGKVYAALQKENRIRELESSITEEKVFTFLTEQSTITES